MNYTKSETGYALIIVLFAVVFITIITAVFMRGALSNMTQEKTVDENNLVVVSAESGVEYYTWELKKVYDEVALKAEFNSLERKAIEREESPIDYLFIQSEIAKNFEDKLNKRASELESETAKALNNVDYSHKLITVDVVRTIEKGDIIFTVKGTVRGYLPQSVKLQEKDKILVFELSYRFPKVELAGGTVPVDPGVVPPSGGSLVMMPSLKEPVEPLSPMKIIGIPKQGVICISSDNKIENKKCDVNGISESSYTIKKSSIYLNNTLNSWGTISIVNSFMNIIQNFTSKNIVIEDTEVVVGNDITANGGSTSLNKTKMKAVNYTNTGQDSIAKFDAVQMALSGNLTIQRANIQNSVISTKNLTINSSNNKFNKTDLKVTNSYTSGGVVIENSNLDIGGSLTTNGDPLFHVKESNVSISGDVRTTKGSDIENSTIKIVGNFINNHLTLKIDESDVYVGGSVSATNGTDLEDVNMVVMGDYSSSQIFKIDDTNLRIGGILTLGNGGEMEDSLLIANRITSGNALKLEDSVVYADYIKLDIMNLEESKVCVKDFNVRSLVIDDDSNIYYSNSSSHKRKNIIKLSTDEFEKKCSIISSDVPKDPATPQATGSVKWQPPVLEKVTY